MATASKMVGKAKDEEQTGKEAEQTEAQAAEAKDKKKGKVVEDVFVSTSHMVENLSKVKALSLVKALLENVEEQEFKIGGCLSTIQVNNFWEDSKTPEGVPYESFKAFIEGEYGMAYRKAMYLKGNYENLIESGVPEEKVKGIGWTKLKEISAIITLENVDEWVERAKSMTVIQLIDYVKQMKKTKVDPNGNPALPQEKSDQTTITFKVHADQKATIQQAVEKAMGDAKTEFQNVAMEHICMTYIEGKVGKVKKITQTLEEVLKNNTIEDIFAEIEKQYPQYDITVVEK